MVPHLTVGGAVPGLAHHPAVMSGERAMGRACWHWSTITLGTGTFRHHRIESGSCVRGNDIFRGIMELTCSNTWLQWPQEPRSRWVMRWPGITSSWSSTWWVNSSKEQALALSGNLSTLGTHQLSEVMKGRASTVSVASVRSQVSMFSTMVGLLALQGMVCGAWCMAGW